MRPVPTWMLACLGMVGCSDPGSPTAGSGGANSGGGGASGDTGSGGRGGAGGQNAACTFVEEDGTCFVVEGLAAGATHSCAILDDGTLRCWGGNAYGQLGDPSFTDKIWSKPRKVPGLSGVVEVALGFRHSCALTDAGEVWCWGSNALGELGRGTTSVLGATPTRVSLPRVTAISARFSNTCAAGAEGQVWCWGFVLNGQGWQGDVDVGEGQPTPTPVAGLEAVDEVAVLTSGGQFACAASGGLAALYCWGAGMLGQLGHGTKEDSPAAVAVMTDGLGPSLDLTASEEHACALDGDGQTIRCWGNLLWTDPIVRPPSPQILDRLSDATVERLDSGWRYSCLRASDASVRCWGLNHDLQMGAPSSVFIHDRPMRVDGLPPVDRLAVGRNHSCVLTADREVWCWGRNDAGQLGAGFAGWPSEPVPVAW